MRHGWFVVALMLAANSWAAGDKQTPIGEYRPGELLVKFKADRVVSGKALLARQKAHAVRRFRHTGVEHWRIDENALHATLQSLRASGDVEFAEPNYRRYSRAVPDESSLGSFDQQWGLQNTGQLISDPDGSARGTAGADMALADAWNLRTDASTVVLAVIDDSVDINHPDLAENIWTNAAELNGTAGEDDDGNGLIDDVHGWDFANGDNNPSADHSGEGHGTAVAGCSGARGDNSIGVAGVAWQVQIMPLKFGMDVASELEAVDYAIQKRADIVNASWGAPQFSFSEASAVDALEKAGILLVTAAGNSAFDNDLVPDYPSSLPNSNIVAVAASTIDDKLTGWTQFGQTSVDLAAPGEHIYTTMSSVAPIGNGGATSYDYTQGTSFSSPYVAGIAALLKAHYPTATAQELRGRLIASAEPAGTQGITATDGRADAHGALTATPAPVLVIAQVNVDDTSTGNGNRRLEPGESAALSVTLENAWLDATGVTATLSTTDPLVTVTQPTGNYGDMAGGTTGAAVFPVTLATSATGHRRILFRLDLTSGSYSVTRYFRLETGLLQSGVVYAQMLQEDAQDGVQVFHVQVPAGSSALQVSVSAAVDIDLALRAGAVPQFHPCYWSGYAECVGDDTYVAASVSGDETITLNAPAAGTYYVMVINYDGRANLAYSIVADYGANDLTGAVAADAGADITAVGLAQVTLAGTGRSDGAMITSYQWRQISGTGGTLAGADQSIAMFTAPAVTTATDFLFRLTVVDDQGRSDSDEVTVTVLPGNAAQLPADFGSGGGGTLAPLGLLSLLLVAGLRHRRQTRWTLLALALAVTGCAVESERTPTASESTDETWLVSFAAGTERTTARRQLEEAGAELLSEYRHQPTFHVRLNGPTAESRLRRLPGVVSVESNQPRPLRPPVSP